MRSSFGTITVRKSSKDGKAVSLLARYVNPVDHKTRIGKRFGLGQKAIAQEWLDNEEEYWNDCVRKHADWLSPKAREEAERAREEAEREREIPFREYADRFLDTYRTIDGRTTTGATMRKKREAVAHLDGLFGDMLISDIDVMAVDRLFEEGDALGPHALRRAYQVLKAICRKAVKEKVLDASPCTRPNPRLPKSKQAEIPQASREELEAIYRAMPGYSRIAVYLGAVFGLRISEVCALQRRDFDFKQGVLHVRHAVGRGQTDTGELELKEPKNEASAADQPIPALFVPMLRGHLERYCAPGDDAMVIRPRRSAIMAPNSLRSQFEKARTAADRPDLRFHTLRATAITAAAQVGGTPKEVQLYGRHADAKTSMERYQRATEQGERQLSNKVFGMLVTPERTRELVESELEEAERALVDIQSRITSLRSELDSLC